MAREYLRQNISLPTILVRDECGCEINFVENSISDICTTEKIWQLLVEEIREEPEIKRGDQKYRYIAMLMENDFDPARGKGLIKAYLKTVASALLNATDILLFSTPCYGPQSCGQFIFAGGHRLHRGSRYTVVVENGKQIQNYIDELWSAEGETEDDE